MRNRASEVFKRSSPFSQRSPLQLLGVKTRTRNAIGSKLRDSPGFASASVRVGLGEGETGAFALRSVVILRLELHVITWSCTIEQIR